MTVFQIFTAVFLTAFLLLILALIYSFIRTAGGTRYSLVFYGKDKFGRPGEFVQRRYRGVWHFLFRMADTLRYFYPLLRIFVFRTLPPGFREKIMITTAISNSCLL